MPQSPFQNFPPKTGVDDAPIPPIRRLQSPAERFHAGEIERDSHDAPSNKSLSGQQSMADIEDGDQGNDIAIEPHAPVNSDPFERLPDSKSNIEPRGKRGAEAQRVRRQTKPHAPHYHEKKPHAVTHKPIKPSVETEPSNDWDKAAQNSMARAALARRKSRMRRIIGRIALASFALFTVWAGATALTAPQFEVNRVEVTGVQRTSPEKVKALKEQLVGKNVFRAPKSRVEAEVKAIPIVADAHITRAWSWPPHMTMHITERQPFLQVGAGTTWWVTDANGVVFRPADSNDSQIYMLTSPELKPVIGKPLPAVQWKRARQLQEDLAADNALVARENGGSAKGSSSGAGESKFWDLRRVYLDENSAAALRISDKGSLKKHGETLIRLGDEGWPEKLKQARLALAFFDRTGRKASEIDLVSSEHPRWLPKPEGPQSTPEVAQELKTTAD